MNDIEFFLNEIICGEEWVLVGCSRELVWGVKREGGLFGLCVWEWGCRGEVVLICDFGGRVCWCEEFWEGEME